MVVFAPVWGVLADRYGRKPMVLRSMVGGAIILLMMGYSRNVYDLVILRFLQGILTGTVSASVALVSSVTPRRRSGFALGMMQAAVFLGVSIGPLIGGELAELDQIGFRGTFLIASVLLLAGAVLVRFFVREDFSPPPDPVNGHLRSFGEVFAVAGFGSALLALFMVRFAGSAFAPVFPLFVKNLLGTGTGAIAQTGRVMAISGVTAAIAAGFLGIYGDRFGHKPLLVVSTLAAALVTLPMAFATKVAHLYVLRALFGLAAAGIMPSANAIIRNIMQEKHLGKAYGVMQSVASLGMGIGPLIGGYMAASMGLTAPFILTAFVFLLTVGFVAWRVR
jgi:DHA1 family multidrug resistance protein-like MFS transporter